MSQFASDCNSYFGHHDFDITRTRAYPPTQCAVSGCDERLETVRVSDSQFQCCAKHGLRFHHGTFVYYNGPTKEEGQKASLRNFVFAPKFVAKHILGSAEKAETHRLGYEISEDALSWNVFAGLQLGGKLRDAASWLTGKAVNSTPDLYAWGSSVDLTRGTRPSFFPPLAQVRQQLEPDIHRFVTEPDIMLVIPGELVICVEAKFASGNPMTSDMLAEPGEKPKSTSELVDRYLGARGSWPREGEYIDRHKLAQIIPSQLFRNIVFAARMAESFGPRAEWHVVNLVSSTQWRKRKDISSPSHQDPTPTIQEFVVDAARANFTFRTWENLFSNLIERDPALDRLRGYIEGKSAHYEPAFTDSRVR